MSKSRNDSKIYNANDDEDIGDNLADSIVIQAVKDFRRASVNYISGIEMDASLKVIEDVIDFIYSDWYIVISDIRPDRLIRRLMIELIDTFLSDTTLCHDKLCEERLCNILEMK